jgi:MFS family permease
MSRIQKILGEPTWWGGDAHKFFTVATFIVLASLDNAARGVLAPLYAVLARDFNVPEAALGFVSASSILVVAVTAVLWGYWGDRGSRKRLLLLGTLIWSTAMLLTGLAQSYAQLLAFQLVTAVGIGCISSVGFSVVSDFIPPARRGLAMSFWGLSQGGGGGAGAMLGGFLGATNWSMPFFVVAGAGLLFALLYLFTFEPQRGRAEPELRRLFAAGGEYRHRISRRDVRAILDNRSNRWLLAQTLVATIGYGSLVWMPRLFIARVQAEGYSLETATMSGNFLSLLMQTGFYFAILAGHLGDAFQRRRPDGRALFCAVALLASIPFQMVVFFVPLHGLALPDNGGVIPVALATLLSIVTNPWVFGAFAVALVAMAFASVDIPNRNALLTDVNLPEHRGTMAGFITVAAGLGVALGNLLTGLAFGWLSGWFSEPLYYAAGLALFQLLFIPAALGYAGLARTVPADITSARRTLARRAAETGL